MTIVWLYTWKELLRKKVTLIGGIMTILFWVALWFIAGAIVGDRTATPPLNSASISNIMEQFLDSALILSFGLFFSSFAVAFLSIFSAVGAITGDAEQGILQSILARPLSRSRWYFSRWAGFVSFGIAYAAILYASVIAIAWLQSGHMLPLSNLTIGFVLFALTVPLIVSLTLTGSCWLTPIGNGIGITLLVCIGWLGGMIEKILATEVIRNESLMTLQTIAGLISMVIPSDSLQQRMFGELFAVQDLAGMIDLSSLGPFSVPQLPSNAFLVYAVIYIAALYVAGMLSLRRKDF